MEGSSWMGPHQTFTVCLRPAHLLFRCMMSMTGMHPEVKFIVKKGHIQFLATNYARDAYASVEMKALTAASWDPDPFAIEIDPSVWSRLLQSPIFEHSNDSLWIYKIGCFPDLYCLVGNESIPVRLGETVFIAPDSLDVQKIEEHPVKIHMRTECLREVISSFSYIHEDVGLFVYNDSVKWQTIRGERTYNAENGDCMIEGVEPERRWYLLLRWRGPEILAFASTFSEDVTICTLTQKGWRHWTKFVLLFDGQLPFVYMTQASNTVVINDG